MRHAAGERDHELRAEWMYDILNTYYTAEQMVILDESSKDDRTLIRKYGRALALVLTVSLDRGIHYSILAALTLDSYIAIRAASVKGSINGEEFFDFVVNDLVYENIP